MREKSIDTSPIVLFQPKLVRKPEIDKDGDLILEGFFETRPERVNFFLVFRAVKGSWKLFAIRVTTSIVQAETAKPKAVVVEPETTNGQPERIEKPESLGVFDDWSAYTYKVPDSKVCYVFSSPKGSEPKNVKRDPTFFLVTHMPGRKLWGQVSTIIGYPFKKETNAELTIDEMKFTLFTDADRAWAESAIIGKEIVTAMKTGKTFKLKGTSWRGTQTEDTYSLVGISAALTAIDNACE